MGEHVVATEPQWSKIVSKHFGMITNAMAYMNHVCLGDEVAMYLLLALIDSRVIESSDSTVYSFETMKAAFSLSTRMA